jgi:hypothetical protein
MTDVSDFRSLPPEVQAVMRKYRIIGPVKAADGSVTEGWTQVRIDSTDGSPDGKPLGVGPLLARNVVARLIAADKTPNKMWLDWMLFQAGGGKEGQKRSEHLIQKSKALFFEERVGGFTENGVTYPARSRAEVERLWRANEAKFLVDLTVGDQDLASPPRSIFGFYRHWPGKGRVYERVAVAVNTFLKLQAKAKQLNKIMSDNGMTDKMVSLKPKDYPTIESLEQANRNIHQFHASAKARTDIQVQTVYDDDYLTVLVPLTYAAAVKYGFDEWAFSNQRSFEDDLKNGKSRTWNGEDVFVYVDFKVPMPPWMGQVKNGTASRHELDRLALVIPFDEIANLNVDTVKMYDTESRSILTLAALKQQILSEPKRVYDPEQEEFPEHLGAPVFKDEQEAQQVVQHLDAGLSALKNWGRSFDMSKIVSNFMGDAP